MIDTSRFSENNSKYMISMLMLIICFPYLIFAMITFQVDFSIQIWVYLIVIISMAFLFTVVPLREYKIHQGPCMNTLFQIGPVVYLNHTMRELVLGIQGEIEEMRFDWSDGNIKLREKTTIFLNAKRQVLAQESSSVKKDKSIAKNPKSLKLLSDALKIDPSEPPMQQIANFLAKSEEDFEIVFQESPRKSKTEMATPEDQIAAYKNKLFKPEANEIVVQKQGKQEITVKPELADFSDLGVTTKEQKEILKKMYFYKVPLYHPEVIDGYEHLQFDKAFFVLPGPFHEVLSSSPLELYDYSGYKCDARGCSVIWDCLGFVRGKIPLFYCMGSENIAKMQDIEAIEAQKLKHGTLYYLRLKIYEYLLDQLTYEQDPFMDQINTLESQKKAIRDKYHDLLGEYMLDTMKVGNPVLEHENRVLQEKLSSAKKWKPVSIIVSIILIISLFLVFFMVIPMSLNISAPPT